MLLDQAHLCIVEFVCNIGDYTGNDDPGDAEPFLPAVAPWQVLNAFEERDLRDVLQQIGYS